MKLINWILDLASDETRMVNIYSLKNDPEVAAKREKLIKEQIQKNPKKYRVTSRNFESKSA